MGRKLGGKVGMTLSSNGVEVIVKTLKQDGPACVSGVQLEDVILAFANENTSDELAWIKVSSFSEGHLPTLMAGHHATCDFQETREHTTLVYVCIHTQHTHTHTRKPTLT